MPRSRPALLALLLASVLAIAGLAPAVIAEEVPVLTNGCVDSVPEPGATDPVAICYTIHRPAGADAEHPVPVIFHSHGWGGSRTTGEGSFDDWNAAGFAVLSFDQRGFGESGGKAHVEHPDYEGEDVARLVDLVATLSWVAMESEGDPVLGAIGGSYGGGYQMVGAFSELIDGNDTRFDALAPEITWFDLKQSLAPQEVVRTTWVTALYAAGAEAHTDTVHKGFAVGAATGNWPKGEIDSSIDLDAFFEKNGPAWHVSEGRQLDIPVLFGQGVSDNLFNLNQGLANFDQALTPEARANSIFISYNGGHVLPNALPRSAAASGDPCSQDLAGGSFGDLAIAFFRKHLKQEDVELPATGVYHLATADGACLTVDSVVPNLDVPLGQIISTAGPGAPLHHQIATGPITVAGAPRVYAEITTLGLDSRAFFGLAVGTSAADATVVQNNLLPLREATAVTGAPRMIELPAITVEVPEGMSLFLTVTPVADMYFGHGSRTPDLITLDNVVVQLPRVGS